MVHPMLAWISTSGNRSLRALIAPTSVRMKSRIPAPTNFSVFARNRGISPDAGRVLKATRRTFPRERA